jgi:hypothetical protein
VSAVLDSPEAPPARDPKKVRAGQIGAEARWHERTPRVLHIEDLTIEQRRLVLALVEAARSAKPAPQPSQP